MPSKLSKAVVEAEYTDKEGDFWRLIEEVAEISETAVHRNWQSPSHSYSHKEVVRFIDKLSTSLRKKADIDFFDNASGKLNLSIPKNVNIGNIHSVVRDIATQVVQEMHDDVQPHRKSKISIPDALRVIQFIYDSIGYRVVRGTGNHILKEYMEDLMFNRKIINFSPRKIEHVTVAYSVLLGKNETALPQIEKSLLVKNGLYYCFSSVPRGKDAERDSETTELTRLEARLRRLRFPGFTSLSKPGYVIDELKRAIRSPDGMLFESLPEDLMPWLKEIRPDEYERQVGSGRRK